VAPRPAPRVAVRAAGRAIKTRLKVRVVSRRGDVIAKAEVIGFTDFRERIGDQAVTDDRGVAVLHLPSGAGRLERLYVFPRMANWGALRRGLALRPLLQVRLE